MPLKPSFAEILHRILPRVVDHYPTPFHIYDAVGIIRSHERLVAAFRRMPFRQHFAVKALPNPHIISHLNAAGSGFDCSSVTEMQIAASVGVVGSNTLFTSNNTTEAEFRFARETGAQVIIDDASALRVMSSLPPTLGIRVAFPAPDTGVFSSKFGIPLPALDSVIAEATSRGVKGIGLHTMSSTNELSAARAAGSAFRLMKVAVDVAQKHEVALAFLNLGGGLGIPYHPTEPEFDVDEFATLVFKGWSELFTSASGRPNIYLECGRYITGPHGVLVTRVLNNMEKGRRFVGLDASMSALMRPALYPTAYHHISVPFADRPYQTQVVDVVGSLCENNDRFATDRVLPITKPNDIVLIHDTGAHGHSMGFNYNGRLRPAELLLHNDGSVIEIRRPETVEDYLRGISWNTISTR